MFPNMSALFLEAGPTKSKLQSSHDLLLTSEIIVYCTKHSGKEIERESEKERDRETPAAHTLTCMLRSIKLAWVQY